ncbi:DUF2254 domain-containing protein [Loktanella sp. TSTF-M6]|uniref:DUF2254 domain-containing protein n=1 Tax=Loktanella gaetbuli TaxID=2881335 RepID=A0ABS8BT79_9RHOB|nr:DUF2254 domain-containing protein [Loktanella gaetbuli]MCB5198930.1 DUF2254 domain-containing protein [Loktanella gaetbuli]
MAAVPGRALVRKLLDDVRASYWAVPSGFVIAALILAFGMEWIDRNAQDLPFALPDAWIDTQGDGARQTLATMATAIIGVAGVMFSMTLVAVSFAADTFGPRLIGNFMRDRGTQISFGLLLGVFTYNMFILRAIKGPIDGQAPFVAQYAMVVAMVLMVIAIFTMIYYVHHVPETINVSNIASDLGHRFGRDIRRLIETRPTIEVEQISPRTDQITTDLHLKTAGYIQQMDVAALNEQAQSHDWLIDVMHAPGTFISPHVSVASVKSSKALTDSQLQGLRDAFATGNARTEDQATPFIGDQLCEMIARALSPGFNDPFTAMNCLNWLHAGLMDGLLYKGGLHPITPQRVAIHHTDFGDLLGPFERAAPYTVTDRMARLRHRELAQSLIARMPSDHAQRHGLDRLVRTLDQPEEDITV